MGSKAKEERYKEKAARTGARRVTVETNIQFDTVTNKYLVTFYYGAADGETKRTHKSFSTLREAQAALGAFTAEKERGKLENAKPQMTLSECIQEYIDDSSIRGRIVQTTARGYEVILRRVQKHTIGKKRIISLTLADIDEYTGELVREGELKAATINKDVDLISVALGYAYRREYIRDNPAERVEKFKEEHVEHQTYTVEEIKQLMGALKESGNITLRAAVCLGVCQGLRRGEISGLKWRDIDFEKGVIPEIYETYTQVGSKLIVKPPKTEKSKRRVVLAEPSIEALKDLEGEQRERGILGEYVFLTESGGRLNPTDLSNTFGEFLDAHNLRHIRFHDLRHTYATLAIERGASINQVSGALGHSTAGTTFAYYIHSGDDSSEKVNETMKEVWEGL